jgi:hypothetical protein
MAGADPQHPTASILLRLRGSAAPYLSVLFLATVISVFVHYLVPLTPTIKGQALGVVSHFLLFGIAFVLWLIYQPGFRGGRLLGIFLGLAAIQWLTIMILGRIDQALFNYTALLYLPALAMIWWKPPRFPEVRFAMDVVAWALIAMSIASQVLDVAGLKAMNHEFVLRWPIMTDLFGVITRWEGPFGNVNYAGPIGAFLVVYGLCRTSWSRLAFVAAGVVILIASEARTSFVATAVGVGVIFVFSPRIGRISIPAWLRIGSVGLGLLALVIVLVGPDSDLNSRTPLWSTYFALWQTSPLDGVGESGIAQDINIGLIPGWASHAHSVYLDSLVRYGVIGLLTVLLTLTAGMWICVKAAHAGAPVGAALLATFIVGGLTETIIDWRYLSIQGISMVAAVVLAAAWLRDRSGPHTRTHADEEHQPSLTQ